MSYQVESIPINTINKSSENLNVWVLGTFIVWPFLGFLFACKNFHQPFSRKIILSFFMLYGLTFFLNPAMDGQRRADQLKEVYNEPFENVFLSLEKLYEETLDFVEPFLMYSVSRLSDFHGILFAVYALIFGALMLYYLKVIYGHLLVNKNLNALLFFVLLIAVNPVNEINGFRMWTAAWVYAVGVLMYTHEKKNKALLFAAFAMFIHFSFMPLVALLFIYVFLGNRVVFYGVAAIVTFFVSELDIEQVRSYAALLGTASELKITAYTNEGYMEAVGELNAQAAWFVTLKSNGIKYFLILSLLLVFIKTKGYFKNNLTESFYSFALLILSFANLSSLLPSGGRFMVIFNMFAFTAILLFYVYEYGNRKFNLLNKLALPIALLYVVFAFRLFSDSASVYLFGPSITMFLAFTDNISLQSVLF